MCINHHKTSKETHLGVPFAGLGVSREEGSFALRSRLCVFTVIEARSLPFIIGLEIPKKRTISLSTLSA